MYNIQSAYCVSLASHFLKKNQDYSIFPSILPSFIKLVQFDKALDARKCLKVVIVWGPVSTESFVVEKHQTHNPPPILQNHQKLF